MIAALAAFGAGALGVSTHRDPALAETGAGRAAAESRALAAEVAAALTQQRRAGETALHSPELVAALALVAADMPAHVRSSILDPAMQKLASVHRPYNFVLVDPAGQARRGVGRGSSATAGRSTSPSWTAWRTASP